MKCQFRIYLDEEKAKEHDRAPGWYKCNNDACGGVVRCVDVCNTHFVKLREDNKIRVDKDMEIPNDTSLLKLKKRLVRKLILDENQSN